MIIKINEKELLNMDYCTNKTPYELDEEYRLFLAKILNKAHEAQRDFLKLSPENRLRFERQMQTALQGFSVAQVIDLLTNWRSNV